MMNRRNLLVAAPAMLMAAVIPASAAPRKVVWAFSIASGRKLECEAEESEWGQHPARILLRGVDPETVAYLASLPPVFPHRLGSSAALRMGSFSRFEHKPSKGELRLEITHVAWGSTGQVG